MSKPVFRSVVTLLAAGLALAACGGGTPAASTSGTTPGQASAPLQAATEASGTSAGGGGGTQAAVNSVAIATGTVVSGVPVPAGATETDVPFDDESTMPFVDPFGDSDSTTGTFFSGNWGYAGGFMQQSLGATQACLTFRQYAGAAFGSFDGSTTSHYRADVTAWAYQTSDQYAGMIGAPIGIVGYAPYFHDSTHYLLAVAKPQTIEIWAVDGDAPGRAWPLSDLLFTRTLTTRTTVGTKVVWAVEVDQAAQSATIYANGEKLTTVITHLLGEGASHVALASNGNFVDFQNMKLFKF